MNLRLMSLLIPGLRYWSHQASSAGTARRRRSPSPPNAATSPRIKNTLGVTGAVQVVPTGTIERSTGKMRRVIDQRRG